MAATVCCSVPRAGGRPHCCIGRRRCPTHIFLGAQPSGQSTAQPTLSRESTRRSRPSMLSSKPSLSPSPKSIYSLAPPVGATIGTHYPHEHKLLAGAQHLRGGGMPAPIGRCGAGRDPRRAGRHQRPPLPLRSHETHHQQGGGSQTSRLNGMINNTDQHSGNHTTQRAATPGSSSMPFNPSSVPLRARSGHTHFVVSNPGRITGRLSMSGSTRSSATSHGRAGDGHEQCAGRQRETSGPPGG
jgi:hypothetical protein